MKNMGSTDRAVRLVIGVVLLVLALFTGVGGAGWVHWLMMIVGAVMVLTSAIGVCPAYLPFGIKTCPRK